MFKLITDPAVDPVVEVDLTIPGDTRPAVAMEHAGGGFQNLEFPTPHGATNVIYRRRKHGLVLDVKRFPFDQYEQLLRLIERRRRVHVLPNWDSSTLFSAPLSKSTWAWARVISTGILGKGNGTFTGGGGWYGAPGAQLFSKLAGGARFLPSAVGYGIVLESDHSTQCSPHPLDPSTPLWVSGTGSPTVAFTTDKKSPDPDQDQVIRVSHAGGAAWDVTYSFTASSSTAKIVHAAIWAAGAGTITLSLTMGAQTISSSPVILTGLWQKIAIAPTEKTDASTSWTLKISGSSTVYANRVFLGPILCYLEANANKSPENQYYGLLGARTADSLQYTGVDNPDGPFSVSCCGLVPPAQSTAVLWGTSLANTYLKWTASGLEFSAGGATVVISINLLAWLGIINEPFWACGVFDPGGRGLELTLRIIGTTTVWTNTTASPAAGSTASSYIEIGDQTDAPASVNVQHVRLDARAWSSREVTLHGRMFAEDSFRNLIMQTTGRIYTVVNENLAELGASGIMQGGILLEEIAKDSRMVVVD